MIDFNRIQIPILAFGDVMIILLNSGPYSHHHPPTDKVVDEVTQNSNR